MRMLCWTFLVVQSASALLLGLVYLITGRGFGWVVFTALCIGLWAYNIDELRWQERK
jgi:hypothetical protein